MFRRIVGCAALVLAVRTRIFASIVALATLAGVPIAASALSATPESELRVDWARASRGDRAVISGYVYNTHQMRAENVRLRVEQLDAAAQPVASRVAWVVGTIPHGDRGYFEVVMPAADAAYRVTVESFDRAGCGNG
jgi:hypothetical protein